MDSSILGALGGAIALGLATWWWIWRGVGRGDDGDILDLAATTGGMSSSQKWEKSGLTPAGIMISLIGFVVSIGAGQMDVSPFGGLANIDAIGMRGMVFDLGIGLIVVGAVLFCSGRVVNELRRATARLDSRASPQRNSAPLRIVEN